MITENSSPKCRTEFDRKDTPKRYYCYCRKEIDPQFDPWLIPHSCGQTCGKRLVPECGHICLLLCHPGPCPPCPKQVNVKCFCNQSAPTARRCGYKGWSCGKSCSKLLSCQQHRCEQVSKLESWKEKWLFSVNRLVMPANVCHVEKRVLGLVNVEKWKQYEIVMNWIFNVIK